jgi:hypothetical protein
VEASVHRELDERLRGTRAEAARAVAADAARNDTAEQLTVTRDERAQFKSESESYRAAAEEELEKAYAASQEALHAAQADADSQLSVEVSMREALQGQLALAQRENRRLTNEEATVVAEAKRSSLAFPETQQRLRNAHAVIDEGIGPRWLTSTFEMGDVLILSIFTLHASTDNLSPEIRLSSDTRYQLASEPADERWVGEAASRNVNPHQEIMHKKGYVC